MTFQSLDISAGGAFILVDDLSLFKVGDKIEMEMAKGGRRHDMGKATIVRKQKEVDREGMILEQGIGVQFITADPDRLTWLMSIMGKTKKQKEKISLDQAKEMIAAKKKKKKK